jgi:hypothetical protein
MRAICYPNGMQKHTQQLVLMLVIGIFLGAGMNSLYHAERNAQLLSSEENMQLAATNTDAVIAAVANKSSIGAAMNFPLPASVPSNTRVGLSVRDQEAGKTVAVSGLTVAASSWVAIYDNKQNAPGSILGAARVNPNIDEALVELLRPEGTTAGETYYAAILSDNGDAEFDLKSDIPPASADKVVVVSFKAL